MQFICILYELCLSLWQEEICLKENLLYSIFCDKDTVFHISWEESFSKKKLMSKWFRAERFVHSLLLHPSCIHVFIWSSLTYIFIYFLCSKTGFSFSFQLMSFLVFIVNSKFFKVLLLAMNWFFCYEYIVHNKKIHRCRVKSQNMTLWNKEHMSERKKF